MDACKADSRSFHVLRSTRVCHGRPAQLAALLLQYAHYSAMQGQTTWKCANLQGQRLRVSIRLSAFETAVAGLAVTAADFSAYCHGYSQLHQVTLQPVGPLLHAPQHHHRHSGKISPHGGATREICDDGTAGCNVTNAAGKRHGTVRQPDELQGQPDCHSTRA